MTNPIKQLRSLFPQDTVQVGESQGPNGDGTTDVILVGGGRITVTGEGFASGVPVFTKGTQLAGQAPSLTVVDINV